MRNRRTTLVELLLCSPVTAREAASIIGCGKPTVYRWLRELPHLRFIWQHNTSGPAAKAYYL
jgi:transposase